MSPLTPHSFSFNSPLGWCPDCEGLGTQNGTSPALLLDPRLSLRQGAIRMWPALDENSKSENGVTELAAPMLERFCKSVGIPLDTPVEKLSNGQRRAILHGTGSRWFEVETAKGVRLNFSGKACFRPSNTRLASARNCAQDSIPLWPKLPVPPAMARD